MKACPGVTKASFEMIHTTLVKWCAPRSSLAKSQQASRLNKCFARSHFDRHLAIFSEPRLLTGEPRPGKLEGGNGSACRSIPQSEGGLHAGTALPSDCCHLNEGAVRVHCQYRDDSAVGKEQMVERTVSVHEHLSALAADVFNIRYKALEIAGGQSEQKPIAGPI